MQMEQQLDKVTELILSLHPLYFRKFFYGAEVSATEVARYKILGIAEIAGPLPISEIGKRLFISRPYMTRLLEGMIAEGLIERNTDDKDRRIINILITDAGRTYLRQAREHHKVRMRTILSTLEEEDLIQLAELLPRLNRILANLGRRDD
ncbi:MAG: MarR family transcriptional regulator [Methanoregulaceae archaeon]|jgi:DNA-binding MarR family transcriptional regulator|nr:MarR family transcriptional regulator [Methanoregulaceae archaeon]MCU0628631.1 MarR family transcriptional regulator [Methanoregulaceae archaeon]